MERLAREDANLVGVPCGLLGSGDVLLCEDDSAGWEGGNPFPSAVPKPIEGGAAEARDEGGRAPRWIGVSHPSVSFEDGVHAG